MTTTDPQPFNPHAWIGKASYLIDVLLADPVARTELDRLCALSLAESLSTERVQWSEDCRKVAQAVAAWRSVA